MLKDSKNKNKENNYVGNNKSTNIINNYMNNFNNFNINYLSKNYRIYDDKDDYIYKNINNLIKSNENTNMDCWSYNNKRINYDNSLLELIDIDINNTYNVKIDKLFCKYGK